MPKFRVLVIGEPDSYESLVHKDFDKPFLPRVGEAIRTNQWQSLTVSRVEHLFDSNDMPVIECNSNEYTVTQLLTHELGWSEGDGITMDKTES